MPPRFPFVHLASQSPRRRQLLEQLGVRFAVLLPPDAAQAESLESIRPGEAAERYVQRVTASKLEHALRWSSCTGGVILCADTTVAQGRDILGKPQDAAQAADMLRQLSGRTHQVLTAVAVAAGDARLASLSTTQVRFAELDAADIRDYVASGEWQGKAGGYAIQGLAAQFVAHISGSYSGVMGLPLFETAALLRRAAQQLSRRAPAH
ncbi:MAG: Maf family protein [Ottowia sp.]|nr:Maf family nucleotide pyrophosphatase [Ottowia sp.]